MSWKVMRMMLDTRLPNLTPSQKLVLLALARYGSDTGDSIYPAVATLATNSNLSPSQVQKILRRLEKIGYVEVVQRSAGGNFYATTLRRLNLALIFEDGKRASTGDTRGGRAKAAGRGSVDDTAGVMNGSPLLRH
jgi:hypothetical protein